MPLDTMNWPTTEIDETTALLIRARGFVERGWCRGTLARDTAGREVGPTNERAVAWCAFRALLMVGVPYLPGARFHPAYHRVNDAMNGEQIHRFNDRQEIVEPILAAFDRAIAAGRPRRSRSRG
jgi:hypothetical protein